MFKKILLIVGVLLILLLLAYLFVIFGMQEKKEKSIDELPTILHPMPSLIVNISGTMGKRYLKLSLVIEYKTRKPEITKKLFNTQSVFINDTLIMLLSSKTIDAIDGYAKKELLKEEIRQKLQKVLFSDATGKITNIYYKSFLIQ